MINLIIDVGNSDLKICTGNASTISVRSIKRFSYSGLNFEKDVNGFLKNYIAGLIYDRIGISVLNQNKRSALKKFFSSVSEINPQFIGRDSELPFSISYSKGLGNDRICSSAGALSIVKNKNILVIDFGTATTYTLVLNKVLSKGIIAPGIKTSLYSLIRKTDLPEVNLKFPDKLFTGNTKENIRAGVFYQALYSAERIIKEAKNDYGNIFVFATGGFAELISKNTDQIDKTDRNLVLKGINNILNR